MEHLAVTMTRCPNSIFVGLGNSKAWKVPSHFDDEAEEMSKVLDKYNVPQINIVDQVASMSMRDPFHFADTADNRSTLTNSWERLLM